MNINIDLLKIDDYNEVSQIWSSIDTVGLRSIDDSREGIHKFLLRNPNTNFVCRQENKIVGVILAGHDGRRGYIYHAAVLESHRNRGLGKKLVKSVINALKKESINKIALVVFSNNDSGNMFWESLGFKIRDDLNYRNLSINRDNI